MKKTSLRLILCLLLTCMLAFAGCSGEEKKPKPSPDEVLQTLKDGNKRFLDGKSEYAHLDKQRMMQSSREDQGDYAIATVLASSDSRVPVEAIFDAGVMDLYVVRVPGNVCGPNQVSAIEYGIETVRTPVVLVLGNTQCASVTAVTRAMNGQDVKSKLPLLENIEPAVKSAMEKYPKAKGDEIIPLAIEENIYTSIRDLFAQSPATCDLVKEGKVKVVGAIYDVSDGLVYWLEDETIDGIFQEVANPVDDTQALDTPAASDEAVPEASEINEEAAETHEDAVEAIAPADAEEAVEEAHDTEISHEAAPEDSDGHDEVAPEAHEDAPDASEPAEADETPAEHEAHHSHSHS